MVSFTIISILTLVVIVYVMVQVVEKDNETW